MILNAATQEQVNEINSNFKYSLDEVKTGKVWFDGKPIYRKTIYVSSLPDTDVMYIPIDNNLHRPTKLEGFAWHKNNPINTLPLPHYYGETASMGMFVNPDGSLCIATYSNRSLYEAYITIEYTKTTD